MPAIYDSTQQNYPRDLAGYGRDTPHPQWPGRARVAVQFVLNYEEGGENSVLHGDAGSEQFLSEMFNPASYPARHLSMEGIYEYGSRAGVWRILREFERRRLPLTVFGIGMALQRHPDVAKAFVELGHEIASHGWRWIDYHRMDEATEAAEIARCVETIERLSGVRPVGWYTGRISPRTRSLVARHGGFLYDSDAYDDDLPHYVTAAGKPHLVISYTLDNNDMKFAVPPGFGDPDGFERHLRDAFDLLLEEGRAGSPKMMSVGLHCRLIGRPGRARALQRFLAHVAKHGGDVWVCRRADIARHWWQEHPPR